MESETKYSRDILFWAGVSGILVAFGYFIISICFAISGFPLPSDGESWIKYLDGKIELWNIIIWLSIITDILYVIIAFGFIKFYENNYRFWVVLASIFFILFVVLELAGTWSLYPTIIELYKNYTVSDSPAKQSIYLGAIEYSSTHFQTTANAFYAIVLPSMAVIIYCLVMLIEKGFGKLIPVIGLISGTCNIVSVFGGLVYEPLEKLIMTGSFLSLFWFLGTGIKFIRESRKIIDLST
jgi:small-conductance mechanosensitive channel